MNRKKLLAYLASAGYKGKLELADIKAWLKAENTELVGADNKPIDLDAAWAEKAVVKIADDPPETKDADTTGAEEEDDDFEEDAGEAAVIAAGKKAIAAERKAKRGSGFAAIGHVNGNPDTARDQRTSIAAFNRKRMYKSYDARAAAWQGGAFLTAPPEDNMDQRVPFGCAEEAELHGAWARKTYLDLRPDQAMYYPDHVREEDNAIVTKANLETVFSSGGFTIPEIFLPSIIRIRTAYGAVRSLLSFVPMSGVKELVPRDLTSGATVYAPGEGIVATEGNPTGDQVQLVSFEMVALVTASRRLLAHSAINFGDFIANNMAYAIEKKTDEIYFLGDGTSTYFNQMGLLGKLAKLVTDAAGTWTLGTNATNAAYAAAVTVASSTTWGSMTEKADLIPVISGTAFLEGPQNEKIVCSKQFYYQVILQLMQTHGGVTQMEIVNGVPRPVYNGFPVIWSNVFPKATGATILPLMYCGDFGLGSKIGEVSGSQEMSQSDQRYWELRKIGFQYSTQMAFNPHDLGNASATATSRVAGPIACLIASTS